MPAAFVGLLALVMAFLPSSPFQEYISRIDSIPYLAELNWFVPVPEILTIMEAWLACVVIYYLYSAIMRWIKVIG